LNTLKLITRKKESTYWLTGTTTDWQVESQPHKGSSPPTIVTYSGTQIPSTTLEEWGRLPIPGQKGAQIWLYHYPEEIPSSSDDEPPHSKLTTEEVKAEIAEKTKKVKGGKKTKSKLKESKEIIKKEDIKHVDIKQETTYIKQYPHKRGHSSRATNRLEPPLVLLIQYAQGRFGFDGEDGEPCDGVVFAVEVEAHRVVRKVIS
jgi:hypothetical protein